jgi:thermitase
MSVVVVALAVSLVLPGSATADFVGNQLIVGFKKGTSAREQKRIVGRARGNTRKRFQAIRASVVRPRSGLGLKRLRKLLLRSPKVRYVERDPFAGILKAPNDPFYESQYSENGSISTAATDAWNVGTGCSKVAVLDTGVDTDHPDLKDNLYTNGGETPDNGKDDDKNGYVDDYHGINLVQGKGNGEDDNGHGTFVSGIIAGRGNNGIGISGVCWSAQIIPIKVMDSSARGATSDVIDGIEYAIKRGAKVVNGSFASSSKSQALEDEIKHAKDRGVLLVVAAGNHSNNIDNEKSYPASFTGGNLLVVAASTPADGLATFSNYGKLNVDVAAPGQGILTTDIGGRYKTINGTSMATPMVAGLAGLLRAKNPDATYSQIRSAICGSVDKLPAFNGKTRCGGRVNLARALGRIGG